MIIFSDKKLITQNGVKYILGDTFCNFPTKTANATDFNPTFNNVFNANIELQYPSSPSFPIVIPAAVPPVICKNVVNINFKKFVLLVTQFPNIYSNDITTHVNNVPLVIIPNRTCIFSVFNA